MSSWKEVEHGGMKRPNKDEVSYAPPLCRFGTTEYYVVAANNIGANVRVAPENWAICCHQPTWVLSDALILRRVTPSTNRKSGSFVRVITEESMTGMLLSPA